MLRSVTGRAETAPKLRSPLTRAFAAIVARVAFVAGIAWPTFAYACPACLGTDARNAMFLKVGSLFVLVPFVIVGIVLYVVRQAPSERAERRVQ